MKQISVIIPVYNENKTILEVVRSVAHEFAKLEVGYEIIVVNDGSTDSTSSVLSNLNELNTRIINHPYNKGYGASLKSGVKNAQYPWVLFLDADGQHKASYIPDFLKYMPEYELITGDRSKNKYAGPTIRKPGLWILRIIANYLVQSNIPDLNCGMRLIKKDSLLAFLHLMPNGFSMSTTSTLAFIKDGKNVKFIPIEVNKRDEASKSYVKPGDAISVLVLIFRIVMIFSPLRIFLPTSIALLVVGMGFFIYDIRLLNISESTIFILLTAILVFFFGLIADQIALIRREIKK